MGLTIFITIIISSAALGTIVAIMSGKSSLGGA
jgi:hypothetical protein